MSLSKGVAVLPPDLVNPPQVVAFRLEDDGSIPNSPLPLLIYESALKLETDDPAGTVEQLLAGHDWGNCWRNGIYSYHHYHSNSHEVLAVFAGTATVRFGGPKGVTRSLRKGDVVVIPAGVAHKCVGASVSFRVVGAYPHSQSWDMCYGQPAERPEADQNLGKVPMPSQDPVYGKSGVLFEHWKATPAQEG